MYPDHLGARRAGHNDRMVFWPVLPVRSSRLLLRPLTEDDVEALFAYRSMPAVCRWVPFEPMSLETVASRVRDQWRNLVLESSGDAMTLGVELLATGEVVGDVMLRLESEEHSCAEIGYVFHPAFGGKGYATEAASSLLHVAFDQLGLHRVIARLDAANEASAAVVARLGMRQEAHLVQNEWFKGEWSDELDFAMLRSEWSAPRPDGGEAPT
jgi:RimJ/RimL family protein N-acetyltransferase